MHVFRDRGRELQRLAGARMCEAEFIGVQQWPGNLLLRLAIYRIAHKRMANVRHVNPNLMRPPGMQRQLDVRAIGALLQHPVIRLGGSTMFDIRRHFLPVALAATNDGFNFPGEPRELAGTDGPVNLRHAARFELRDQTLVRDIGLRDDDAAARAFVEPVDDAGPFDAADAGELAPAMVEQCVDEGVLEVASGGVDDHAGGFVDDDEVGIFVEHGERDGFWLVFQRAGSRNLNRDGIAGARLVTRLAGFAVNKHLRVIDQFLEERPGMRR